MTDYLTNDTELTTVADAIRELGGTSSPLSYPFGWVDALNSIETWPYGECGDLQGSVVSSTGLASRTSIASNTFRGNKSIAFASFPRVSVMSSTAFSGCTNLKAVILPSLATIPLRAFTGCTNLEYAIFSGCTSISGLGGSVASHPFSGCEKLNLELPAFTASLPSGAFANIHIHGISAGCSIIGSAAFWGASIQTVNFPSCKYISYYAFQNCSRLVSINFPSCSIIRDYAFASCSSLTDVNFPECTLVDGMLVFCSCYRLKTANFPVCSDVGASMFYSCSALEVASFPACTEVWHMGFMGCTMLTRLNLFGSTVAELQNSNAFKFTPIADSAYTGYYGSIYVPASLLTAYQTATNWTYYSERFVGLTDEEIAAL